MNEGRSEWMNFTWQKQIHCLIFNKNLLLVWWLINMLLICVEASKFQIKNIRLWHSIGLNFPFLINHSKVWKAKQRDGLGARLQIPTGQGLYLLCLFLYFQPKRGWLTVGTQKIFVAWMNTYYGFYFTVKCHYLLSYARENIPSGVLAPKQVYT